MTNEIKLNKTVLNEPTLITRKICLEPRLLNSNVKSHLLEKIKEITMNECTKEYGYILRVDKITKIINNFISHANSGIIFTITFEAETLKPNIGDIILGTVCIILTKGIFVDIKDKMKILIPPSSLTDYTVDKTNSYYEHNITKKRINKGDVITIKIIGVQYSDKAFVCFGNIVD